MQQKINDTNESLQEWTERILKGVRMGIKEMVIESAAHNRNLIIGDKDGNIQDIPAKDLLPIVMDENYI